MNENAKTVTFLAAGLIVLAVGIVLRLPTTDVDGVGEELSKEFYPELKTALDDKKSDLVAQAEVVDFDVAGGRPQSMKVARSDGAWTIQPERQRYPQMAVDQLAGVVNAVAGAKKLNIVSDDPNDARKYGVVDPGNEEELKTGSDGVGKRVSLFDDRNNLLFQLVLGTSADQDESKHLVYARRPGQDRIYVTELDTAPLSARFEDWAKPDLLDVGSASLRKLEVNDLAIDLKRVGEVENPLGLIEVQLQEHLLERSKAAFAKEAKADGGDEWKVVRFDTFDKTTKAYAPRKAEDGEEVDTSKLGGLEGDLRNIRIVDVVRKPPVLAEDLAKDKTFLSNGASKVLSDRRSLATLQGLGFTPRRKAPGSSELELLCQEGDMTVGFNDGVQYRLAFGGISSRGQENAEATADGGSLTPGRFLLVMAEFNQDLIPRPKLEPLPPEAPAGGETKPAAGTPPAAGSSATPGGTAAPAAPAPPMPTPSPTAAKTPAAPPASGAAPDGGGCEAAGECDDPVVSDSSAKPAPVASATPNATASPTPTKPAATPTGTAGPVATAPGPAAAAPPAASPTAKASPTATAAPSLPATPAAAAPAATAAPATATPAAPATQEPPLTPERRKQIEVENKQKTEQYEKDVAAGREKAKRLNGLFADWFYVVSDATFQDLNVDPLTLVKKKDPPAPASGQPAPVPGLPGIPNLQNLIPNP